jgi:HEAT repeat protein
MLHKLRAALGDLDLVRVDAAVALGEVDTDESRRALEEASQDSDLFVRSNAWSALRQLRTGVFDPIAQKVEEGWTATYQEDGSVTLTPPQKPGRKQERS